MSELLKLKWSLPPKDEDYEESEDFMAFKHKNHEINDDSGIASKKAKFDINSTDDTVTFIESKNCTQNIDFNKQNSEIINFSLHGYFNEFKNNEKVFGTGSIKSNKSGFDLFESDKLKFSLNTSCSIISPSFDESKPKKIKIKRLSPEFTETFEEEKDITSSFVAKQVQECEEFTKALVYSQDKPCSLLPDKKYSVLTKKKKIKTDINYFKRDYSLFDTIKNIKMLRKKGQNEFLNNEQQEKYPITLQDFIW